jgi:sugar phosphate isomerase/epimerase
MLRYPLGIQLYSVRELTAKDFRGTLQMLAHLGYGAVEFAGYGGVPASEMRGWLGELDLRVVGSHVQIDDLQKEFDREADYLNGIGGEFLIVPWPPERFTRDEAGWAKLGRELADLAAKAKQRGLRFAYHNHALEIARIGGRVGFEIILEHAGPDVSAEIDTHWVAAGGESPSVLIRQLAGRCALLHIKDMHPDGKRDCPIGDGTLDWPGIQFAAEEAGVEAFVVEQEQYSGPHEPDLRRTVQNARRMGLVE